MSNRKKIYKLNSYQFSSKIILGDEYMKLTTKGRYAITIMLNLAAHYEEDEFLSLKEISEEENISLKYLEKIMLNLKKENLVISSRGQEGGYKLAYKPSHYKLGDILKIAEDDLAPASCMKSDTVCEKKSVCKTYPIWDDLNNVLMNYLNSKTLADYIERK